MVKQYVYSARNWKSDLTLNCTALKPQIPKVKVSYCHTGVDRRILIPSKQIYKRTTYLNVFNTEFDQINSNGK